LKLNGHYQYYGIRGNYESLAAYYEYVKRAWRKWLGSRGGKKRMTVKRFFELLEVLKLPKPRIIHSI
jgi:RNA-directed DNA polymerase